MRHENIPIDRVVKIYFKEHDPRGVMIGKFVELHDHSSLKSKGMIRWLPYSRFDDWQPDLRPMEFTKIFVVSDFSQIKIVKDEEVSN